MHAFRLFLGMLQLWSSWASVLGNFSAELRDRSSLRKMIAVQ
jgi:uncharacterized membrane protein